MRALREIPSSDQIHQSWISTVHHLGLSNTMDTVPSNYHFSDQPSKIFSALEFSFDISPSSLLVSIIKQQKLNKSFWYFCHIFCDIFSIFLWYFCHIFCNIFVTFLWYFCRIEFQQKRRLWLRCTIWFIWANEFDVSPQKLIASFWLKLLQQHKNKNNNSASKYCNNNIWKRRHVSIPAL